MTELLKVEETKEQKEAIASTREICQQSIELKVTDKETFDLSFDKRVLLSKAKEKVELTFKPAVDSAIKAKRTAEESRKAIVALRDKALLPFERAEALLIEQREIYTTEQLRLEAVKEKKKQDAIDLKEAKAKEKLDEEARLLREKADKLKEEGKEEQADVLEEQAKEKIEEKEDVYIPPPDIPRHETTQKTEDRTLFYKDVLQVSFPESENAIKATCKAIAEGKDGFSTSFVSFNKKPIQDYGKMYKKKGVVHGITFLWKKVEEMRKK